MDKNAASAWTMTLLTAASAWTKMTAAAAKRQEGGNNGGSRSLETKMDGAAGTKECFFGRLSAFRNSASMGIPAVRHVLDYLLPACIACPVLLKHPVLKASPPVLSHPSDHEPLRHWEGAASMGIPAVRYVLDYLAYVYPPYPSVGWVLRLGWVFRPN